MIRSQIAALLRKPAVRIKMLMITFLFIPAVFEQMSNVIGYSSQFRGGDQTTVAVVLLETFNYLFFYVDILIVGYILLIPDIVRDEYLEKQAVMHCISRKKAAVSALMRIIAFSVLYVAWFVFLTVLMSGIRIHDFSLEWPAYLSIMFKKLKVEGQHMGLIMLADGFMEYPVLAAVILVLLRSTLGFIFLGLLSGLITLLTKKTKYGVGVIVFLLAVAVFLYYDFDYCRIVFYDRALQLVQRDHIDVYKLTIIPLFSFRDISDDFNYWIWYGILSGLALCIITGIGVWIYYKKGDLGNADQDE